MKHTVAILLLNVILSVHVSMGSKKMGDAARHLKMLRADSDESTSIHDEKRFASFFQKSAGSMVAQDRQKLKSQQWRWLPDRECSSEPCMYNSDCCKYASICHKQAKMCTECMFRDACSTDAQCCSSYPYCDNPTKQPGAGQCTNIEP